MKRNNQFLEILFTDEVAPDDLEFIRLATAKTPGLVRLDQAQVGQPHPQAPNSRPVFSGLGPKFGFVADAELMEPPYTFTYIIKNGNGKNGRGTDQA